MLLALALGLSLQPDPAMLQRMFEEGLTRREREYGAKDVRTAAAAHDLGLFLRDAGERQPAYRALSQALSIHESVLGREATKTLEDAADLATVAEPREAEALWKRASTSSNAALAARAFASLAELREAANDRPAALILYREALAKEELASGREGARVAVRLNAVAILSDPAAAIPILERAVRINRRAWGERHPETATSQANLSGELLAAGRAADAVRVGKSALTNFDATLGPEHPRTAAAASGLADALRSVGDRAGAERLYRRALAIDEKAFGKGHPETLDDVRNLADFLRETGRSREAAELEREANAR